MCNLTWCNKCKEASVVTVCRAKANGARQRVEYCINLVCGYSKELPFINKEYYANHL